jgi:hypothetical protein
MNRDDKVLAVYPPHLEEGASMSASEKRYRRVAPVSKDAAATDLGLPEIGIKCAQVG